MEQNYILSCCSTADLEKEQFIGRDIHYVCFHYSLDGVNYPDDLGQTIPFDQFYKKLTDGAETKTSQVNVDEYIAYFTPFLAAGKDILHVTLSSGISGTYNSACIARDELKQTFPARKIIIIDSLCASSGYGLMMEKLADLRDSGVPLDALADWAEKNRLSMNSWFFSTDLTFYIKGGRVSKAAGLIGGLLNICPLLNMNDEGRLIPREKVRSKKKVIQTLVQRMEENARDGLDYDGECCISHSACYEDAREVADLIKARFPKLSGDVVIHSIGTTIGSHTGPGTVALFFWGKNREA